MKPMLISALAALASGLTTPAAPTPMQLHPETGPVPAELQNLTLPAGRVQLIAATSKMAFLVELDRTEPRRGDRAVVWLMHVVDPPFEMTPARKVVQDVSRAEFDCAAHKHRDLGIVGYDEQGLVTIWITEDDEWLADVPNSAMGILAGVACEGQANPEPIYLGYQEALKGGRAAITRAKSRG